MTQVRLTRRQESQDGECCEEKVSSSIGNLGQHRGGDQADDTVQNVSQTVNCESCVERIYKLDIHVVEVVIEIPVDLRCKGNISLGMTVFPAEINKKDNQPRQASQ